jgi:CheY-like chemotaxis protein
MKILVIDDEATSLALVRYSLTKIGGMQVVEASGGMDGIDKARSHKPDAILLDLVMHDMDGVATFKALRQDAATAAIPVIFLTGMVSQVHALAGLGAKGVLTKPFDPMKLPGQIREILEVPVS